MVVREVTVKPQQVALAVDVETPPAPAPLVILNQFFKATANLRVRQAPNLEADTVDQLRAGETVNGIGKTPNNWVLISRSDNVVIGYVSGRYLIDVPKWVLEGKELKKADLPPPPPPQKPEPQLETVTGVPAVKPVPVVDTATEQAQAEPASGVSTVKAVSGHNDAAAPVVETKTVQVQASAEESIPSPPAKTPPPVVVHVAKQPTHETTSEPAANEVPREQEHAKAATRKIPDNCKILVRNGETVQACKTANGWEVQSNPEHESKTVAQTFSANVPCKVITRTVTLKSGQEQQETVQACKTANGWSIQGAYHSPCFGLRQLHAKQVFFHFPPVV